MMSLFLYCKINHIIIPFFLETRNQHPTFCFVFLLFFNDKNRRRNDALPVYKITLKRREIFVEQGGFQFSERRVLNVRKAREIENNTVIRKFI